MLYIQEEKLRRSLTLIDFVQILIVIGSHYELGKVNEHCRLFRVSVDDFYCGEFNIQKVKAFVVVAAIVILI